jgi:hypothetical protein
MAFDAEVDNDLVAIEAGHLFDSKRNQYWV